MSDPICCAQEQDPKKANVDSSIGVERERERERSGEGIRGTNVQFPSTVTKLSTSLADMNMANLEKEEKREKIYVN